MDLRIAIRDENGEAIRRLTIYQDGSDSEGADAIEDYIRANFTVENEHEQPNQYVIRNGDALRATVDEVTYWNNNMGWVDREDASIFTQDERNNFDLPMYGYWERL